MSNPTGSAAPGEPPAFAERPTDFIIKDAFVLGALPLALAGFAGIAGFPQLGFVLLALTVCVALFFRNPPRFNAGDERPVVAPADGRVIEAGEIEQADGSKACRVAIFLSVFDVHVNRIPIAGRVLSIERGGGKYLAAFNRRAETENARCELTLETAHGERIDVIQIVGLIARRIICHPAEGDWVERGVRYGLIRFGSRTDVVLPLSCELKVRRGDRVSGGSSPLAQLPEIS